MTKFEHVARLLVTPSRGTELRVSANVLMIYCELLTIILKDYISIIVPQLLEILVPVSVSDSRYVNSVGSPSHRRAAAFTISRMMSRKATSGVATPLLRHFLCEPFLHSISRRAETTISKTKSVSQAVLLLSVLVSNADPSPAMIHLLLSPIIVPLYALVQFLEERPGAVLNQVSARELVRGLVSTWTRVIAPKDAVEGWWDIVTGKGGWGLDDTSNDNPSNEWSIDDGELFIVHRLVMFLV